MLEADKTGENARFICHEWFLKISAANKIVE
jgi:hypothetical protein